MGSGFSYPRKIRPADKLEGQSSIVPGDASPLPVPPVRRGSFSSSQGSRSTASSRSSSFTGISNLEEATSGVVNLTIVKALQNSGSLERKSLEVRVLALPSSPAEACSKVSNLDAHMPPFVAKVDFENLLKTINCSMDSSLLALQKLSFMDTEWLAIRLVQGDRAQQIRFACALACLRNVGRKSSRSVVIETSNLQVSFQAFACAPISTMESTRKRHLEDLAPWLDMSDDVAELTSIISNSQMTEKKLQAALAKWATRPCSAQIWVTPGHTPEVSRRRRTSCQGIFGEVERQLAVAAKYDGSRSPSRNSSDGTLSPGRSSVGARSSSNSKDSTSSPRKKPPRVYTEPTLTSLVSKMEAEDMNSSNSKDSTSSPRKKPPRVHTEPTLTSLVSKMEAEDRNNSSNTRRRSKGVYTPRRRASEPMLPTVIDEALVQNAVEHVRSMTVSDELGKRRAQDIYCSGVSESTTASSANSERVGKNGYF